MSSDDEGFLVEHELLTRRWFLRIAGTGLAVSNLPNLMGEDLQLDERMAEAINDLEPYFTSLDNFQDVSRGKPKPHSLDDAKKHEVGLTRETWALDVISDPDHPASLRREFNKADGTAFKFDDLMQLAKTHAVRFPKVMTCLNIGCPLGMGIWEGVPLREVIWQVQPKNNLRRVFYYGYHNDDPEQMFRSSLPIGRVLEDQFDLPPVILCYKLNGQWLTSERGGPVRVVVPEAYGFKSIKWLSHLVLSNISHANDTYAEQNNDVDSPLKSFAATLSIPTNVSPQTPFAITGYAQAGISGLSKVQIWIHNDSQPEPDSGLYYTNAPWKDVTILPPPDQWGGGIPDNTIPQPTHGFDPETGQPLTWPLRLSKVHWAFLQPGLPRGQYTLRCRSVDENGTAQPMPRPFRKSGHAAIEKVSITIE